MRREMAESNHPASPSTDATDATDGDLLISFFDREKKEVERNNMRMAVSAVRAVSPAQDGLGNIVI
jgi:hypothetical protein